MTEEQLSEIHLNQKVVARQLNSKIEMEFKYGYVTKIYKGNYQLQVWFDAEKKPRVVGYTQIELAK